MSISLSELETVFLLAIFAPVLAYPFEYWLTDHYATERRERRAARQAAKAERNARLAMLSAMRKKRADDARAREWPPFRIVRDTAPWSFPLAGIVVMAIHGVLIHLH